MLEDKKCAVKCLGAMHRALGGGSSRRGRAARVAEEMPAEMDGIVWQKKLQQPPLARPTAPQRSFWVSEQLDTAMVMLNDTACSQLIEMRTDTRPPEEKFLAPSETAFMCS